MKVLMVLFFFAMVVCAMSQWYGGSYGYGYNTHTPGASVSHYASNNVHPGYYGANKWW